MFPQICEEIASLFFSPVRCPALGWRIVGNYVRQSRSPTFIYRNPILFDCGDGDGEIRSKFLIGRSSESSAQPPLLGKAKTATGR
jgi:hypothetical protein